MPARKATLSRLLALAALAILSIPGCRKGSDQVPEPDLFLRAGRCAGITTARITALAKDFESPTPLTRQAFDTEAACPTSKTYVFLILDGARASWLSKQIQSIQAQGRYPAPKSIDIRYKFEIADVGKPVRVVYVSRRGEIAEGPDVYVPSGPTWLENSLRFILGDLGVDCRAGPAAD